MLILVSLSLSLSLLLTAIFQVDLGSLHPGLLLELWMMEVVVTTGAIRRAKLQTNRH